MSVAVARSGRLPLGGRLDITPLGPERAFDWVGLRSCTAGKMYGRKPAYDFNLCAKFGLEAYCTKP